MKQPKERQAVQQVAERLGELLGVSPEKVALKVGARSRPAASRTAVVHLGGYTFVVEWKGSGAAATVAMAAEQARSHSAERGGRAIPLVAVPFMGAVGQERCEEAGVSWLDLSGNARIFAPGIRVRIEGQPNRFKRRGRPNSAFAPKSARIARWLLMHPDQPATQREIARATDMDEGFTSRIVAKLEADDLVLRASGGAIRARDPNLLLDAWRESYGFSRHHIRRGHVPARSGDALLRRLAGELRDRQIEYAATGLAAAWVLARFAGFRIVTLYLPEPPRPQILDDLGFREEDSGANVWLAVPDDEGVLHGAAERDGVRCVHPVQAYLDLKSHPERAAEAAKQPRAALLTWSTDG